MKPKRAHRMMRAFLLEPTIAEAEDGKYFGWVDPSGKAVFVDDQNLARHFETAEAAEAFAAEKGLDLKPFNHAWVA